MAQYAEAVEGKKALFVVNFRPEYDGRWMKKSHYEQLPLLPLGPESTAELLAELMGMDPSLDRLKDRIWEKTRGNPFFIEEVVQSLAESGALGATRGRYRLATPLDRLEIPGTVQVILAGRIDRLPEREKELLRTASVIGKNFPEPILRKVSRVPELELRTISRNSSRERPSSSQGGVKTASSSSSASSPSPVLSGKETRHRIARRSTPRSSARALSSRRPAPRRSCPSCASSARSSLARPVIGTAG
ncbi:MAG: hypothetical protein ACREQ9_21370, partial [Candidatus Binatia bacterium]